jgi:chorismate mutase
MFDPENGRGELVKDLRQAIHHLDQTGLQLADARMLLLTALRRCLNAAPLSESERSALATDIAKAKNAIGDVIKKSDAESELWISIDAEKRLAREIQELANAKNAD